MPTVGDREDDLGHQQPLKRVKTMTACQNCRTRKLACDGSRPCARCSKDNQECVDVSLQERTPLTRKRMTELEDKLEAYETIWHALCPSLRLDSVQTRASQVGLDAAVQEVKSRFRFFDSTHIEPSSITHHGSATGPLSSRAVAQDSSNPADYPATRPVSPNRSVLIPLNLHDPSHQTSSAWNEEASHEEDIPGASPADNDPIGTTPGNDFGTGVRVGVGYIGLSSGLTLIRAIQKFAPVELLPSNHASETGSKATPASTGKHTASSSRSHRRSDKHEFLVLPPPNETGPLVDTYFRYFHTLTPILHEPTIRAQIMGALPLPTGHGGRVLFNMILATGAFDMAINADSNNGSEYYERARLALQEALFEGGSLILVQGLAIMAIWLQRCNKPNAGYVCLGLAIRMATALGLHVTVPRSENAGLTVLESEMRCRIWWALVTLECGQCMTYGRPHGISLPSLSAVRLPINTDDGLLGVSSINLPTDAQYVTLYTALIIQARLAQLAFHSMDRMSRSHPSPTAEQIKWCGEQFRDNLTALPVYMQPGTSGPYTLARAVQLWRARDYQAIIYRPVLLSAAWDTNGNASSDQIVVEMIEKCRNLALDNLRDITEFVHTNFDPHRGYEWYTLYFAIQASLTILLSIAWEPNHPSATSWHNHIRETIGWLRQLGSMKELGLSYARLMEEILANNTITSREPIQDRTTPPIPRHAAQQSTDIEGLDFERYLFEIWDGQVQNAGLGSDGGIGMLPNFWEDLTTNMGGGF